MAEAESAAQAQDAAQEKPRRSHMGLIIFLLVVAILVAAYVVGIIFFATHAMPGTTVNGKDVSWLSTDRIAQELGQGAQGWEARVSGDGIDLTIAADDIGYGYDTQSMAQRALAQVDAALWIREVFETHDVSVDTQVSYDADKLESLLSSAVDDENARRTQTAEGESGVEVAFDEDTQQFALKDSASAYTVSAERVCEAVEQAIDAQQTDVTLDQSELDANGSFDEGLATANGWLSASMDLYLGDTKVTTVTPAQIAQWVSFDTSATPTLDTEAIATWVKGDLADSLDTVGIDRTYTRPDGKEVSVSGGTYGWEIDADQLASLLTTAIQNDDSSDITVPCTQEAATVNHGGADWGNNYIDIDITEQHARLYDADGNLAWEADIVTGQTDGQHETPTGAYYITSKETDARLVGPEVDGQPEWDSVVKYWFGVVGGRIGLHSAQWRSQFGGNIYTYYGSHGCINISEAKAEEVYPLIEIGMPAIVHY